MAKIIWTFGIIAGAILSIMMSFTLAGDKINFDDGELVGYLTMIIALSTVFIGIKSHRDKNLGGKISFGKAFKVGFAITFIASTMYVGSWMVISHGNDEEFISQYKEHIIKKAEKEGVPEAEINEQISKMDSMAEMYKNPILKAGITYMEILPVGLLITLISAGILKKSNIKGEIE